MATRTVFSDDNGNELECYLNDKDEVFISAGQAGEESPYRGFITLGKDDVSQLIKILTAIEEKM